MLGKLQRFQCRLNILIVKPVGCILEVEIIEDQSRCCDVSKGPSLGYSGLLFHVCISQARTGSWRISSYNVIWVETRDMASVLVFLLNWEVMTKLSSEEGMSEMD